MKIDNYSLFQHAQLPVMWVGTADVLLMAAAPIYYAAAEQLPKYERASEEAEREARSLADKSQNKMGTALINAAEPAFLPAFLLYGFAIENLLKGLYMKNNPGKEGKEKVAVPKSHDLNVLAAAAGYTPTSDEAELLEKLSTIITWSGRYPVALNRQQHGKAGLWREAIFSDPVGAGIDTRALADKIRALVEPRPHDPTKGGAIVIWDD